MKRAIMLSLLLFMGTLLAAAEWEELLKEGRKEFENEKYERALELFTEAIKILPEGEELYLMRALAYTNIMMYYEAINDCYTLLEIAPFNADAYYLLGQIYDRQSNYEKAENCLNRAILLDNIYSWHYDSKEGTYLWQNIMKKVFKSYIKRVEADLPKSKIPFSSVNLYYRFKMYNLTNNYYFLLNNNETENTYLVRKRYNTSYRLSKIGFSSSQEILGNARSKMNKYDYKGALEDLNIIVEREPNFTSVYNVRAELYLKTGEKEKALNDCNKLIELEENDSFSYFIRAEYYREIGDYKKSLKDLEIAYSIEPENIGILRELIYNSLARGDRKSASKYISRSKALEISNDLYYFKSMAFLLNQLGEYKEALDFSNKALESDIYAPYVWCARALIMLNLQEENNSEIEVILKKMIALKPEDSELHYYSSLIYSMLGQYNEALKSAKYTIKLKPGEPYNYFNYYNQSKLSASSVDLENATQNLRALDRKYMMDGWTDKITSYLIGDIDKEELLREAGTDLPKLCEANFYIAMSLIDNDDLMAVRRYLQRSLDTGMIHYYEYQMSHYFLNNFSLISNR